MSTQVCRNQSFSKGSLSAIGKEFDHDPNVNHRNSDIDLERSHLNVTYKAPEHGFYAEWSEIKKDLNVQYRDTKNAVAFEGLVITADKAFFERLGYVEGQPMTPEMKGFFDRAYDWAKEQIGYHGTDRNIIGAKVHMDEGTPHFHIYYVPLVDQWREKVYAKGEDGKVLRTERGTPIQAKDENGKTLYRTVEDPTAPKLSRTEFWQQRGGQSSYRQMQDSFHERVGKPYGLDRGEIGSDRKHKTKAQYEYEQMQSRLEPLRSDVAILDQAESITVRKLPMGKALVDQGQIQTMQDNTATMAAQAALVRQQADQLRQKELEMAEQRKKEQAELDADRSRLIGREARTRADWANLERAEKTLRADKAEFERQKREYEPRLAAVAKREREVQHLRDLPAKYEAVVAENEVLREKVNELTTENKRLSERLSEAVEWVKETVQSFALFRYAFGRDAEYRTKFAPKQGVLFGCIVDRVEGWLRDRGHEEAAVQLRQYRPLAPELRQETEVKWSQREWESEAMLSTKEHQEAMRPAVEAQLAARQLSHEREPKTQGQSR